MRSLLDWIGNLVGRIIYPAYYHIDYEESLGEEFRPWRIRESKDDD